MLVRGRSSQAIPSASYFATLHCYYTATSPDRVLLLDTRVLGYTPGKMAANA